MAGKSAFGNLRKLPSGRWQARYTGPDLVTYSGPSTFTTKGDAQAWLSVERALISQQRWTSPLVRAAEAAKEVERRRASTFAVYSEQWLEGRVTMRGKALRPSTVAGYRNALDVHILPAFGALPLDEINSAVVRHWRAGSQRAATTPPGRRRTASSRRSCRPRRRTS